MILRAVMTEMPLPKPVPTAKRAVPFAMPPAKRSLVLQASVVMVYFKLNKEKNAMRV